MGNRRILDESFDPQMYVLPMFRMFLSAVWPFVVCTAAKECEITAGVIIRAIRLCCQNRPVQLGQGFHTRVSSPKHCVSKQSAILNLQKVLTNYSGALV